MCVFFWFFFFQAEDGIRDRLVTGVQTCALPICFKPVSLKYRTKFQRTNEDGELPEELIRNKFTIEYKLGKKIEPYLSGELFHLYNTNHNQLDGFRVSFGFAVDLPRKNSIKIFYIYKKEDITKSSPDEINVFGLAYSFKW